MNAHVGHERYRRGTQGYSSGQWRGTQRYSRWYCRGKWRGALGGTFKASSVEYFAILSCSQVIIERHSTGTRKRTRAAYRRGIGSPAAGQCRGIVEYSIGTNAEPTRSQRGVLTGFQRGTAGYWRGTAGVLRGYWVLHGGLGIGQSYSSGIRGYQRCSRGYSREVL